MRPVRPDSELQREISQEPRDDYAEMDVHPGAWKITADSRSQRMCQFKRLGSTPVVSGSKFLEVVLYLDRKQAIQHAVS